MENQDWQRIVESLVDAKRCLSKGLAGARWKRRRRPRVSERALGATLSSIDTIYAIEDVNAFNADVASPVEVQQFSERHGARPGFAVGT